MSVKVTRTLPPYRDRDSVALQRRRIVRLGFSQALVKTAEVLLGVGPGICEAR